jgi:hypothetical protein
VLTPLSADEAQALLGGDLDDATRIMLYRESGGNPFYLEQLVRGTQSGGWRPTVVSAQPSGRWSPPAVVAAAIHDELIQVFAEARLALDAAAVAGESFERLSSSRPSPTVPCRGPSTCLMRWPRQT